MAGNYLFQIIVGLRHHLAQFRRYQTAGLLVTRFVPVAEPHRRVLEPVEKYMMRFGVGLECRRQIEHFKFFSPSQFSYSPVGIEQIADGEFLLEPPARQR